MKKTSTVIMTMCVVAITAACTKIAATSDADDVKSDSPLPPHVSAKVKDLMGGADAYKLIVDPTKATKIEAYRIDGMGGFNPKDKRKKIHEYPILSGPVDVDAKSRATIADVLTKEETYLWDIAKGCEFLPGVALRFTNEKTTVDVLICFSCDEIEIYKNGEEVGHEDVDPRRADLVRIAKKLFPNDKDIRALKIKD